MHLMFGGMFGGHFVSSNVTHPPPTDRYHSYSPMLSMMLGTCGALVSKRAKKREALLAFVSWPKIDKPGAKSDHYAS